MAETFEDLPVVLTVSTEEYACSNCHMNTKVSKLPTENLCYSTWHREPVSRGIATLFQMPCGVAEVFGG